MAQPASWSSTTSYTTYATQHPSAPFPPASLDTDFAALGVTISEILANLVLIQRDDGQLANASVTVNALATDTKNLIGGWNPRGAWVTATNYAVKDMVTPSGGTLTYVCAVANTSGATFAADLALGYWQQVNNNQATGVTPASITFASTDVLLGRQSAGAGAGEEITLTASGRTLISQASLAAVATALGLGTGSSAVFANVTDSALTAGEVVLAGTSGLLSSSANLSYLAAADAFSNFGVGIGTNAPAHPLHVKSSTGTGGTTICAESPAGALSSLLLVNPTDTVEIFQYQSGSEFGIQLSSSAAGGVIAYMTSVGYTLSTARKLQWGVASANPDVALGEQATGSLMQYCPGANAGPQKFGVANTFTDVANYESACISWASNRAQFGTEKNGSGTAREMALMTGGTQQWIVDTAGIFRPTTANNGLVDVGSSTARTRTLYANNINLASGTLILGQAAVRIDPAQSLTSQTTLQNVTGLQVTMGANDEWVGTFELEVGAALATTGVKLAVTAPTGATVFVGAGLIPDHVGAGNLNYKSTTSSGTALDFTAASQVGVNTAFFSVRVRVAGDGIHSGSIQLQFAQSTSSATAVSISAGSFMRFTRIA